MEKFSVLMSVYHCEKGMFLREAMRSIFEQTIPPTQVVLVKDGPLTEELDEVVADFSSKYDTLKVVSLPQNVGLGEALNQGLAHCSYELVARMDSDDICREDRFEKQLAKFAENPELSLVGSWIDEFHDDPSKIKSRRTPPTTHSQLLKFFKRKSPVNHMTVMFKRQAVLAAGSYQSFYLLEDYWLWARMLSTGAVFCNIDQSLVLVRGGSTMAARRGGWKYTKSEIKLQRNFYRLQLIDLPTMCFNIAIRFTVRMVPNRVRLFIYSTLLRK